MTLVGSLACGLRRFQGLRGGFLCSLVGDLLRCGDLRGRFCPRRCERPFYVILVRSLVCGCSAGLWRFRGLPGGFSRSLVGDLLWCGGLSGRFCPLPL